MELDQTCKHYGECQNRYAYIYAIELLARVGGRTLGYNIKCELCNMFEKGE